MVTILGAGGAIGDELVKQLAARGEPIRLVSRNPTQVGGAAEAISADLTNLDQTIRAVAGSRIAFLVVGLPYRVEVWREQWPRIMKNAIEAAKRSNAKLIFFDNVYMYGNVDGPMTEETPFRPCSEKGEIRAHVATMLLEEVKAGRLSALIARSADFYGPRVRTSVLNLLVFDKLAKRKRAMWLVNDSVKHSFTFTPDAARSLVMLADADHAWNQTWHVPTASDPPTGKQYVELVARELRTEPKSRVLGRSLLKVAGWFDSTIRELYEMLYQYEFDYVFDSTKFNRAFNLEPTAYLQGVHATAEPYLADVERERVVSSTRTGSRPSAA